jgi:Tfp pilus assembly protein PilF
MPKRVLLLIVVTVLAVAGCRTSPQEVKHQALERAKKRIAAGDYSRAALEFKTASQADPKDAETYYQAALAYLAMPDLRSATAALQQATQLNPKHTAAQIKLAELLSAAPRNSGLLQNAERRMEAVLASAPGNPYALSALAYAELRLGQFEDAEKHLSESLSKAPANLKAAVGLAQVRIAQSKVGEAETILRSVADQTVPSATALIVLGEFYLNNNRPAEARREFLRALDVDNKSDIALLYIAGMQVGAGETDAATATYKRVSNLSNSKHRTMYARFLFHIGKRNEAIVELERFADAEPASRSMRHDLISAYLTTGRFADAEKVIGAALKTNAKDVDALLDGARVYLLTGKRALALETINSVLQFYPNAAGAHYLKALVYEQEGKTLMMRDELGEAIRYNPELLQARLQLARMLLASNASQAALNLLSETPDWQKQDADVLAQTNWAMLATGNKGQIRTPREAVLANTPDLLLQNAILRIDRGELPAARTSLEELLKQTPEDTRALDILALTYMKQNQPAAALRRIRDHVQAHSKSALLHQYLGAWLQRSGAMDEARAAFLAAKAEDRAFWLADISLAALDLTQNRFLEARDQLLLLVEHPYAGPHARSLLAVIDHKSGKPADALVQYRKIIERDANNVFALNELAYGLAEHEDKLDEALKLAERAKKVAPDNAAIDDTLGWILYKKKSYNAAVRHLERSVMKQGNATRHAHLASAYIKYGDKARGTAQLQIAAKLDSNHPEVVAAQKVVASAK